MAFHNVLNNAGSTLAAAVATTDLTISVAADVFPAVPFYLTLGTNPSVYEIVEVTLKTGLVFTVGRAKDGTTAKTYVVGDLVQLFMTAGIVSELQTEVIVHEANTAPHGATALATANTIALRDANGNVVSNLPVTNSMNPNLLFNPSFRLGFAGWTSTAGAVQFGTNGEGSQLVVASPTQTTGPYIVGKSALIPVVAGETFTLSTEMYALGVTGGYAATQISYYDASGVQLASPDIGTTLSTGWKRYSITAVAPANATTVSALLYYNSLTSTGGIAWRKIKLEAGSVATTFSDDNTLNTSQYGGVLPLAQILSGGNKIQAGTTPITTSAAAGDYSIVITFPVAFATTPDIINSLGGLTTPGVISGISIFASSATGFTAYLHQTDATARTVNFKWIAVGT